MVIRRVSARLYVAAAMLSLVVVFTGLFLAVLINIRRANWLESQWNRDRAEWHRLQFRYTELLQQLSTENCVAARVALLNSVTNLTAVQRKLDKYLASTFSKANRRFNELKREHAISALEHWSMSVKLRKTCTASASLLPILYLYFGKSCSQCFFQTRILLFVERRYRPGLTVFPVDLDFAPPEQVAQLMDLYAVRTLPAFVIVERKYEGFLSMEGYSSFSPQFPRVAPVVDRIKTGGQSWQTNLLNSSFCCASCD